MTALNDILTGAIGEAEKHKPSDEPSYWAKRSCKHCYGRGKIGTITQKLKGNNTIINELVCRCAQKNFLKWRDEWVTNYMKEKENAAQSG